MSGRKQAIETMPIGLQIANYTTQVAVLIFSVYFLHHNMNLISRHKSYCNLGFIWSVADIIPALANICSVITDYAARDVHATLTI